MKKVMALVISTVLALGLLAGCSSPGETKVEENNEAPVLAFICKDLSQEWFVGTSTAMQETAKSLGAEDVILYDAAMSPDKYMTALDQAIAQEVDVLIVCPPDQQLSQITVQRCEEAGIKVMADDDGLIDENGKHIAPALELDAYVVGASQGEWLAKYYVDNKLEEELDKTAYMVMTMNEVSSCVPRHEGARDTFVENTPNFPEDKIIEANYDGTSDKGFNVVAATITANPDIKNWIITAPNDEGAQGATRALEQAGIDKESCVVGLGGYLAVDEFKKDYSAFKAAAYIDPLMDGEIAATAAMAWITEGKVPYEEYKKDGEDFGIYPFGAVMADANNYKEVMGVE